MVGLFAYKLILAVQSLFRAYVHFKAANKYTLHTLNTTSNLFQALSW